jgi:hypothetical protein
LPPPEGIDFRVVSADEAARQVDELTALFGEVYAEPPYEWGAEYAALFSKRFAGQRRDTGFSLVEARAGDGLIAFGFGVTLAPTTPWWQHLVTPLPAEMTNERVGRTFALVELLVRKPWRRKHVAETIHGRLIQDRHEEWATLTCCLRRSRLGLPMPSGAGARLRRSATHCRDRRYLM